MAAVRLILLLIVAWGTGGTTCAAEWADARVVGPFVCRADFSLASMETVLGNLAQLQDDLVRVLGVPRAKEPVELYLFHDQAAYARYMSRYLPGIPYRRALYVKSQGPGRVFAYWSQEIEVDLRHECTHALLHASLPLVPLWLDEGLAEYFELPAADRAGNSPHLAATRRNARWANVPSLETLEKKGDLSEMGPAEYRDCWAWVHFMLHGPAEARQALGAFLGDLEHATPPGLLSARLGQQFPRLHSQFARHFKTWQVQTGQRLATTR